MKKISRMALLILVGALAAIATACTSPGSSGFGTNAMESPENERVSTRIDELVTSGAGIIEDDISETALQQMIHEMSHQKVVADSKWGSIQMTEERVEALLEVANTNRQSYDHGDVYLDILERWNQGDFSLVDEDHNKIWDLQGGTIGRATGIMSADDEEKYIQKNFK